MACQFLETLFDSGEGIVLGDQYCTEVLVLGESSLPLAAPFFSINPLDTTYDYAKGVPKPARRDLNVTQFRSFLFEMDGIDLESQLNILNNSSIPWTSIVYSGGKSYHAILSLLKPLTAPAHTLEGIMTYKRFWGNLAALIDMEASNLGYKLPNGAESFVDHSCKNPSRFSRYPGTYRAETGNMQQLIKLEGRLPQEEFAILIKKCPKQPQQILTTFTKPENIIDDLEVFQVTMPDNLRRRLKFVDWASDHDMYPKLYRFSTWAIDSTNVTKKCFLEFLEKYTFPVLVERGYPTSKLTVAVDHAFSQKGQP